VDTPKIQELTDGIIYLRPLITGDAADHLAGEDDELAKWLNGGRGTLASVEAFIRDSQENWRQGGPRRAFGVFDCGTDRLVGSMETNLTLLPGPGQVNISYGIFRPWRRRGLALRAINLMDKYLRTETDARQMVLRIAPANTASLKLAEKAGFSLCGGFDEPEGPLDRYVRTIQRI